MTQGYEAHADEFMHTRNPGIGPRTVREWAKTLPPGASILDIGCGHGVPIAQALAADGFDIWGVDASPTLIAAFRERFPQAHAECARAEESTFFNRQFDAALSWGLLFLLPAATQERIIHKAARALVPGGSFFFTSPRRAHTWADATTGCVSVSLGETAYHRILEESGLAVTGHAVDEGNNDYFFSRRS